MATPPQSSAPVIPGIVRIALDVSLVGRVINKSNYTKLKDRGTSGAIAVIPRVSTSNPTAEGWKYTHDASDPGKIGAAEYVDHTYQKATSRVFDAVKWGPPEVSAMWAAGKAVLRPGSMTALTLPLESKYLVQRLEWTGGGKVKSNKLWPLEDWEIDTSLLLIFAYELTLHGASPSTATATLDVVPPEEWAHAGFMGTPSVGGVSEGSDSPATDTPTVDTVAGARTRQVLLGAHYVVVVLNWTCLRPLADFEPSKNVVMTRCLPHSFVLSDLPFHKITSPVQVQRPKKSRHVKPVGSDEEGMGPDFGMMLMTETNIQRATPAPTMGGAPYAPFWQWIFDYYREVNGAVGPLLMVDRSKKGQRPIVAGTRHDPTLDASHRAQEIIKEPGQGAYDNLHISALLQAPKYLQVEHPRLAARLQNIKQAPACDCDCLHVHWRWGTIFPEKHNLGWGAVGPHSGLGTPMIPPNQDLSIACKAPSEFEYQPVARNTRAGEWQVFFHHGMAYALSFPLGAVGGAIAGFIVSASEQFLYLDVRSAFVAPNARVSAFGYTVGVDAALLYKSLFYFYMRYHTLPSSSGGIDAVERVEHAPGMLGVLEAL